MAARCRVAKQSRGRSARGVSDRTYNASGFVAAFLSFLAYKHLDNELGEYHRARYVALKAAFGVAVQQPNRRVANLRESVWGLAPRWRPLEKKRHNAKPRQARSADSCREAVRETTVQHRLPDGPPSPGSQRDSSQFIHAA